MKYLVGDAEKEALKYITQAIQIALSSTCQRARCGSVIVFDNKIIGSGFNSPAKNIEEQRRCSSAKAPYHKKVTDKTCCVHAEQRAIMDALRSNPDLIVGSRLYFVRLAENGDPTYSGKPYCTICSKMALDVGIKEFVLWHEQGIGVYDTAEYNILSFQYSE
jgi:deoxycytidylate deaminase